MKCTMVFWSSNHPYECGSTTHKNDFLVFICFKFMNFFRFMYSFSISFFLIYLIVLNSWNLFNGYDISHLDGILAMYYLCF